MVRVVAIDNTKMMTRSEMPEMSSVVSTIVSSGFIEGLPGPPELRPNETE